jgi:hypothetical protein
MKKALKKLQIERSYLDIIKGILPQTYSQHYTEWGEPKSISSKIRNETRVPPLSILIQYSA